MSPSLPAVSPPRSSSRRGCLPGCLATIVTVVLLTAIVVTVTAVLFTRSPFSAFRYLPLDQVVDEIAQSVMADLGETPDVSPVTPAAFYPIDPSVPAPLVRPLIVAFDLMRGTPDGARLFDLLVDNDVTVSVEPLDYNAGYTASRWTARGWQSSRIVVASRIVQMRKTDLLATILVHEATHADRAITGVACYYTSDCRTMTNGIELDEEIAAHAAEARFWQAMYGRNGKRFAFGSAAGENSLLDAYQKGDEVFAQFIHQLRSDSREGITTSTGSSGSVGSGAFVEPLNKRWIVRKLSQERMWGVTPVVATFTMQ